MATKKQIVENVAKYASTMELISELSKRLKEATENKASMEQMFHDDLAEGMHPAGKFVLEVGTKTKKGRKSTSWKTVAEGVGETLPGISEALTEAFPAEADSFKKFEAEATALHDELLDENTKVGPDVDEPVIKLHETAGKSGKKAEVEADDEPKPKSSRKHQLRVVGG